MSVNQLESDWAMNTSSTNVVALGRGTWFRWLASCSLPLLFLTSDRQVDKLNDISKTRGTPQLFKDWGLSRWTLLSVIDVNCGVAMLRG